MPTLTYFFLGKFLDKQDRKFYDSIDEDDDEELDGSEITSNFSNNPKSWGFQHAPYKVGAVIHSISNDFKL